MATKLMLACTVSLFGIAVAVGRGPHQDPAPDLEADLRLWALSECATRAEPGRGLAAPLPWLSTQGHDPAAVGEALLRMWHDGPPSDVVADYVAAELRWLRRLRRQREHPLFSGAPPQAQTLLNKRFAALDDEDSLRASLRTAFRDRWQSRLAVAMLNSGDDALMEAVQSAASEPRAPLHDIARKIMEEWRSRQR